MSYACLLSLFIASDLNACLENMFERVGDFLPGVHKMLVSLAHDQIEVLVRLAGDEAVMGDTLSVLGDCSPPVSMESIKKRKACSIQASIWVYGCIRQGNNFYAQSGWVCFQITECKMRDGRMVIGQRTVRLHNWSEN